MLKFDSVVESFARDVRAAWLSNAERLVKRSAGRTPDKLWETTAGRTVRCFPENQLEIYLFHHAAHPSAADFKSGLTSYSCQATTDENCWPFMARVGRLRTTAIYSFPFDLGVIRWVPFGSCVALLATHLTLTWPKYFTSLNPWLQF